MRDTEERIYTRKGDEGRTRLLSGESVWKSDTRVETYGILDELQCHLGTARALITSDPARDVIFSVQEDIFIASSELASNPDSRISLKKRIGEEDVRKIEKWIDEFQESHGSPGRFVIPGSSIDSAVLHVARAVCRRGERAIVQLNMESGRAERLLTYFNRLGDLIFVLAWAMEVEATVNQALATILEGSL
ncbi:MAG: cob(I)yrinic acid a,c-diamide adenosyltransferase [Deltaproteobacteria bacterium]|nr:cob(I)yrinic acid a,c-diamide adenosyltransferase [Deltaproteobacteria bacterium]